VLISLLAWASNQTNRVCSVNARFHFSRFVLLFIRTRKKSVDGRARRKAGVTLDLRTNIFLKKCVVVRLHPWDCWFCIYTEVKPFGATLDFTKIVQGMTNKQRRNLSWKI